MKRYLVKGSGPSPFIATDDFSEMIKIAKNLRRVGGFAEVVDMETGEVLFAMRRDKVLVMSSLVIDQMGE